jgi:BMFP domain-containing protein YqiC
MSELPPPISRIASAVAEALPTELGEDVRRNVRVVVQSALARMDVVTTEELEIQEAVLRRTRDKVERLEARLAELEAKLNGSKD